MKGLVSRSGASSEVGGNAIYKLLCSWRSDDMIGGFGLDVGGFLDIHVHYS